MPGDDTGLSVATLGAPNDENDVLSVPADEDEPLVRRDRCAVEVSTDAEAVDWLLSPDFVEANSPPDPLDDQKTPPIRKEGAGAQRIRRVIRVAKSVFPESPVLLALEDPSAALVVVTDRHEAIAPVRIAGKGETVRKLEDLHTRLAGEVPHAYGTTRGLDKRFLSIRRELGARNTVFNPG